LKDYPSFAGKLRFVFHGTILERYGLHTLLSALSKVRQLDRISVLIIGEGDYSAEFSRLIRAFNLESVVNFDNHSYPVHQIPEMLEGAHLGLVPLEISAITNFALPLKLVEYVAMGLPVVTVRSVAISHYFGEEDCFFFDPKDPASLTQIFDSLIENPKQLARARERILQIRGRFLWSNERQTYSRLLWKLAGLPEGAGAQGAPSSVPPEHVLPRQGNS